MLSELRRYPQALMLSVLLHVGLLIAIFVNIDFDDNKKLLKQGEQVKTVKAEVIDQQQLEASKAKKQAEIEKKKKAEQALKKRKADAEKKKRDDAKRKADAKKKKLAEEKRKKAEAKRKAEVKKKAEAKKKAAEKQKKLAEVKHKKAEEKRIAAEKKAAEEKRIAQEKRIADQKAVEKRKAEEAKQAEARKRRLAEEEQKRKQDELRAQLEAEETQRRLKADRSAYELAIQQKITRNWIRPQESGKMPTCEVRVLQGPGGIILDVTFGSCPGGTATYRASIENAVYKAEPLPKPSDPALFDREIMVSFKPR